MTNEQILEKRWNKIDNYLKDYLKDYNKINRKTKDKIQDFLNGINIVYSDINKMISNKQKERLERYLLKLQEKGLLKDYFGYKARLIMNKKKITYLEYIEIMLLAIYIEENQELEEINEIVFYKTCKESYEQGIADIQKIKNIEPIPFKMPIMYALLNIPLLNATADAYLYSIALTNAEETLKNTLINMQMNKELDVDNKNYKLLFNKQRNRYISINIVNVKSDNKTKDKINDRNKDSNEEEIKISGGIANITENLCNLAYLQAGIDTGINKCRFIAERDKRTTRMCKTLDNQIFLLDDWNTYSRYSESDKKNIIYKTYGLKPGENLPPINNHFHWCRSTITYQIDLSREKLNENIITEEEKATLQQWLSSDFYIINEKMRNRQKLTKEEKLKVKYLYRFLNKIPNYNGTIVRVIDVHGKELNNLLKERKVDEIFEEKSFVSYSTKKGYNDEANVIFYIENSKNAKNLIEYNPSESEVLYQYGQRFKTMNYYYDGNKHWFRLEEIDD